MSTKFTKKHVLAVSDLAVGRLTGRHQTSEKLSVGGGDLTILLHVLRSSGCHRRRQLPSSHVAAKSRTIRYSGTELPTLFQKLANKTNDADKKMLVFTQSPLFMVKEMHNLMMPCFPEKLK